MKSAKRDEPADPAAEPAAARGPRRKQPPQPPRKPVPGWLIIVAAGITVVITAWIITKKNPGIWESETAAAPLRIVHATSPALAITEQWQTVAGARAIPPIQAGAANPHADRGPCADCHTVLSAAGIPVPALHSYARMPHPYPGGLCSDCHATLPTVASQVGGAGQLVAAARAAAAPQVTEAEWMGMEVAPLTAITREQYGIPSGINGVVVTEVEGRAQKANLAAGDVIIAFDHTPINDPAGFADATQNGRADRGTLQVFRGGKVLQAAFQPPAAPPPPQQQVAAGDVPAQPLFVPTPQLQQAPPALTQPAAPMVMQQPAPPMVMQQPTQPMVMQQQQMLAPQQQLLMQPPQLPQQGEQPAPMARPEAEAGRRQF